MENLIEKQFNLEICRAMPEDEGKIRCLLDGIGDVANFEIKRFYIAKNGSEIVGCIRTKNIDDSLELSSLVVNPAYQKRGIGSNLIRALLSDEQTRPIFLLTSLDKEVFYKKFGFKIVVPENLLDTPKKEFDRVKALDFAKDIHVIVMIID